MGDNMGGADAINMEPDVIWLGAIQEGMILRLALTDDICNVNVRCNVDVDRFHFRLWIAASDHYSNIPMSFGVRYVMCVLQFFLTNFSEGKRDRGADSGPQSSRRECLPGRYRSV